MSTACLTPGTRRGSKPGDTFSIQYPCGRCPNCLKRRISGWSFRLMQEYKRCSSAHFVTLTYDNKHVPLSKNRFMTVKKKDLQDFMKRLRKAHEPTDQTIKYYTAAEYGGETHRPHYHSIMFNVQAELIEDAWSNGSIHIGDVTSASVGYTLKYISKPSFRRWHANDDRLPEFSLMSKRLGDNYLTPQMIQWHKNDLDNRMFCVIADGKKISMPRYYKDRIYNDIERKRIGLFARAEMISRQIEQYSTPDGEYNFADVDAFCDYYAGVENYNRVQNDMAAFRMMHANTMFNRNTI